MSSSSSDCDGEECFYGGFNNVATPWPIHPLVYYTHVPSRRNQRSREKKHNPNCFVKAFRWYTQERNPCQKNLNTAHSPDIKGFALWLDEKYTEFLHENQVTRMKYKLKETSTFEIDKVSTNLNGYESSSAKKFQRLKSPRKRHRKLTNSKEKGDVLLRTNKSFEFILRPKNISRTASDYYPRQGSCCTNSNATIDKIKRKSQSLTSILVEKEVCSIPYDTIQFENVNNNPAKKEIRDIEDKGIFTTNDESKQLDDVSCQCSVIMEDVDRYGQYQSNSTHRKCKVLCICKREVSSQPQTQILQVNTIEQKLPPCTCANLAPNGPSTCLENDGARIKTTTECTSNGTQTSDYPINLVAAHQYPLFMKVICSNKES